MLRALERRGAIWAEAGRLITPSSRSPNPRERARFLVKGLFPQRWAYRCKYYRGRKYEPMPSDLDPKEVKKFGSPLIVHTVAERTGNEGIDLKDYASAQPTQPSSSDSASPDAERLDWEWDEQDNLANANLSTTCQTILHPEKHAEWVWHRVSTSPSFDRSRTGLFQRLEHRCHERTVQERCMDGESGHEFEHVVRRGRLLESPNATFTNVTTDRCIMTI